MHFLWKHGNYEVVSNRSYRLLTPMPGSPHVGISHSMYMKDIFRGKGFAKQEQADFLDAVKDQREFDYVTCIVNVDNTAQIKTLESCGWKRLDTFRNSCMECDNHLYGRAI